MKNLFYSTADKTLFWIAGYTADNNTHNVGQITESLMWNAVKFAAHCELNTTAVCTLMITKSSKYKHMRVFYSEFPSKIPDDAYQLGDDWTMEKWITN